MLTTFLKIGFDVFLILLAVFNAFERPHKTHADILDSLHRDGAKLFLVSAMIVSILHCSMRRNDFVSVADPFL